MVTWLHSDVLLQRLWLLYGGTSDGGILASKLFNGKRQSYTVYRLCTQKLIIPWCSWYFLKFFLYWPENEASGKFKFWKDDSCLFKDWVIFNWFLTQMAKQTGTLLPPPNYPNKMRWNKIIFDNYRNTNILGEKTTWMTEIAYKVKNNLKVYYRLIEWNFTFLFLIFRTLRSTRPVMKFLLQGTT